MSIYQQIRARALRHWPCQAWPYRPLPAKLWRRDVHVILGVNIFGTNRLVKAKGLIWQARHDFSHGVMDGCPMKRRARQSAYLRTPKALHNRLSFRSIQ